MQHACKLESWLQSNHPLQELWQWNLAFNSDLYQLSLLCQYNTSALEVTSLFPLQWLLETLETQKHHNVVFNIQSFIPKAASTPQPSNIENHRKHEKHGMEIMKMMKAMNTCDIL
jgi:hypothetical protein